MPTKKQQRSLIDWHPADVVAALRKIGWSLAQLTLHHGYTDRSALGQALGRPYPKAERLIAEALGLHPMDVWPSRYDDQGEPNRPRGRPIRPAHAGHITPAKTRRDSQNQKAA